MSGFIAIVNTNGASADRPLLEKLTAALHFKGPDQQQVWADGPVGFGHTLFRTTDEALYEHQPATLDGGVWITGSMRIDAREDLVGKLGISQQVKLQQTPDSELVLRAYQAWGEHCVEHLLGDFAFAIWDGHKQQLFCAKDRFGMRQLYYAQKQHVLIVSNSLQVMLRHPAISMDLNDRAIGGFLLFGDHNWLDKSISAFADVKVLLPAHSLLLRSGELASQRYWDLPPETPLLSYRKESDYIEHFQAVFETAVADRIRSPNIVVSMSGGMDSSAVAAVAGEVISRKYSHPQFSAATITHDKLYHCEERHYAGLVATRLGLPIHYTSGDDFKFLTRGFTPTRPSETVQPDLLEDFHRTLSSRGRTLLTGTAADELLDFPSTVVARKEMKFVDLLAQAIKLKRRYGYTPGLGTGLRRSMKALYSANANAQLPGYPYPSWLNPEFATREQLAECWARNWAPHTEVGGAQPRSALLRESLLTPNWTSEDDFMYSDFTYPEEADPYLDLRMVEFVQSLPAVPWLFNKDILRRALRERLPSEVIKRPKTSLGPMQCAAWEHAGSLRLDKWQAHPELSRYVQRTHIPGLAGGEGDPSARYVNLRPFLLNEWLVQITGN